MITEKQMQDLYNQIAPRLTNYLIANGENYEYACDLVQETFLRIWQRRENFAVEKDSISGIAFQTAKNLRIDAFRKNRLMSITDDFDTVEDERTAQEKTEDSDLVYLRNKLTSALSNIPEDLRVCYTMSKVGELSIKEIASELGINESLVKVRIYRAKELLAPMLMELKNDFL